MGLDFIEILKHWNHPLKFKVANEEDVGTGINMEVEGKITQLKNFAGANHIKPPTQTSVKIESLGPKPQKDPFLPKAPPT